MTVTQDDRWSAIRSGEQPLPTFVGPGPAGPAGDRGWLAPVAFVDESDRGVADARRITLGLLTAEVATLVATGLLLFFVYQPPGTARPDGDVGVLRSLHRFVALATIPTAVAATVLLAVPVLGLRLWREVLAGVALVTMAMAGAITGAWLAWDQIALKAVTVGADRSGYWFLFDGSSQFVLIGGHQVPAGQMVFSLVVHAIILATATVTLLVAIWRPLRGISRDARPTGAVSLSGGRRIGTV